MNRFDSCFAYPYGANKTFHIHYSSDYYDRFYKAQGEAASFVTINKHGVTGTLCSSKKEFFHENKKQQVVYIGNLKILPRLKTSKIIYQLIKALKTQYVEQTHLAYSIVMDRTHGGVFLNDHSRFFPQFNYQKKLFIYSIPTTPACHPSIENILIEDFNSLYDTKKNEQISQRSVLNPIILKDKISLATGILEDTKKAKQHFLNHSELIPQL